MPRPKLTKGNIDFFSEYIQAIYAHVADHRKGPQEESITSYSKELWSSLGPVNRIKQSLAVDETEKDTKLNPDHSAHMAIEGGWYKLLLEEIASSIGKYGQDAITSIGEAALFSNIMASKFGARNLYFRGENKYGYKLQSRAERNLNGEGSKTAGLTQTEINELERFQEEVRDSPELKHSIFGEQLMPDPASPEWLTVMQHHDEKFGTRLLDITSSIYTGLYFASIGWKGEIDTDNDGILYSFMTPGMTVRGFYYDTKPQAFNEEDDSIVPINVKDSFVDWVHPEILRIYISSSSIDRVVAQDGLFLTKGLLQEGYGFGQGFKFRIPGKCKTKIARELWLAGYTPRRIVRGVNGEIAYQSLKTKLGL